MTDNLFDIPETPSPRLKWIAEKQVRTHHHAQSEPAWSAWLPSQDFGPTWSGCYDPAQEDDVGHGDTEDEAIVELARKLNLKLWNEA
jgi:hypothetical protein